MVDWSEKRWLTKPSLTAYFEVWSEASSEGHWSREAGKRSSDPGDWLEKMLTHNKNKGGSLESFGAQTKISFQETRRRGGHESARPEQVAKIEMIQLNETGGLVKVWEIDYCW